MAKYNKSYDSAEEMLDRLDTWLEHDQMIQENNALADEEDPADDPVYLGHNWFSDQTKDEIYQNDHLGSPNDVEEEHDSN